MFRVGKANEDSLSFKEFCIFLWYFFLGCNSKVKYLRFLLIAWIICGLLVCLFVQVYDVHSKSSFSEVLDDEILTE